MVRPSFLGKAFKVEELVTSSVLEENLDDHLRSREQSAHCRPHEIRQEPEGQDRKGHQLRKGTWTGSRSRQIRYDRNGSRSEGLIPWSTRSHETAGSVRRSILARRIAEVELRHHPEPFSCQRRLSVQVERLQEQGHSGVLIQAQKAGENGSTRMWTISTTPL